jgi:Core-2/I-Branching enzyme
MVWRHGHACSICGSSCEMPVRVRVRCLAASSSQFPTESINPDDMMLGCQTTLALHGPCKKSGARRCVADEVYFPSLLAAHNETGMTSRSQSSTYADWSDGGAHPKTFYPQSAEDATSVLHDMKFKRMCALRPSKCFRPFAYFAEHAGDGKQVPDSLSSGHTLYHQAINVGAHLDRQRRSKILPFACSSLFPGALLCLLRLSPHAKGKLWPHCSVCCSAA